jgi:hypothetical protein
MLKKERTFTMQEPIHKNYKITAYILFTASAVTLINHILHYAKHIATGNLVLETALLIAILGYFSLLGKDWLKWVLTFITVITTFALQPILKEFDVYPVYSVLSVVTCALQIIAMPFLFLAPKVR